MLTHYTYLHLPCDRWATLPLHSLRSQLSSNSGIARRFEAQVGDSQGLGCFFAPDETVPTPCDALVMKHCWSEEMRRKAGIEVADKEVFCCINSKWEDENFQKDLTFILSKTEQE